MGDKAQYSNNTAADVTDFHSVIMEAVNNGGVFDEDFSDLFKLTKTPPGSAVDYVLNWA